MVIEWTSIGTFREDAADRAAWEARHSPLPDPEPEPDERETRQGPAPAPEAQTFVRATDASVDDAMDRYASGDNAAFSELYDLLAPRLFAFLLRATRNQSEAEDLVQQTMLKMHCARGRFIRGAGVVPWAFSIARRLVIDRARRAKVRGTMSDSGDAGEVLAHLAALDMAADDVVHSKTLGKLIQQELERLPPRNRLAFELVKQDGLTHAEAAKVLGTTVMAVKLRTHRSCAALRAALHKSLDARDE